MRHYDFQSDALRAILLMYVRGYKHAIVFVASSDKCERIALKWDENYGVNLPAWKRNYRRRSGLPNAWACSMPVAGQHSKRIFVLLTDSDPEAIKRLPEQSPFRRENWRPISVLEIGDYRIAQEKNATGALTNTFKLTTSTISGIDKYWRSLANSDQEMLVSEITRAVQFYTLFGGVRRQLRRLIRGYKRLYELRTQKPWPGPDPEKLPSIGQFRRLNVVNERKLELWTDLI